MIMSIFFVDLIQHFSGQKARKTAEIKGFS